MPVDTSSYQKYYNALQQAYGKDGTIEKGSFTLGYDDFKQKLSNQDYAQKIYGALDQAYGKQGVLERGAFTLPFQDFYKKVTNTASPDTQQSSSATPLLNINDIFRPVKEASMAPQINVPQHVLTGLISDEHSKKVQQAANDLTQTFNQHKDKAIHEIVKKDLLTKLQDMSGRMADDATAKKGLEEQQQKTFARFVNPQADINLFNQQMSTDESKVRQVVSHIAETHPDKANKLKSDMYLLDSQQRTNKAAIILKNAHSIANDLGVDYDVRKANLVQKEGFFSSLGQGFSERNRMMRDYDSYANGAPQDVIKKLEDQRASYDPDIPVNIPYGIGGHLGQAIGSQGIVTAKGAGAAALTTLVPGGEVAAPWLAAAVTSPEFYKTGYVSSLENEYHRLRNQGVNPDEALNKARDKASFDAKIDVAQGILSTAVGTRIGLKPTAFTPTFQNSIKNIALHSGKWLAETGMEGGANALIASGLQELKNIHGGRPSAEGVFETGMGQLMFTYGLGALTKGGRALLNPKAYTSILRTMAKAPESEINGHLAQMVKEGSITGQDATEVHNQLSAQRELDARIPPEISSDKDRGKIQDLIQQRDALDTKLESVDKAYHPELKEQIKVLNEKIATIGKKPSPEETKPSTEPTFHSPEDQAQVEANKQVIQSQLKPEEHGKETQGDAQAQEIGKPEGAVTEAGTASSIVSKSEKIQPTEVFRTWDLGDMEGKPEDEAAKKHLEGVVRAWGRHPAGETGGETFGAFIDRVIPSFDKILKEEPHNTTIVTHSSVLKAFKVWDEMGRPNVERLTPEQTRTFSDLYNKEETHNGDLETFKGTNGDINVIRHGQTEDNAKNNFRSGNTNLTEKGIEDAHNVGQELAEKTSGDVPKIISSDLPRTIHTSNIITDKLNQDAVQEHATGKMGVRDEAAIREGVGGQDRSEQPPTEGEQRPTEEEDKGTGEKATIPPGKGEEWPFIEPSKTGIAERVKKEREFDAGVKAPEPGEGSSVQAMVERGRELLSNGEDAEKVLQDFEKDPKKNISADGVALVRAKLEQLAKATDKAIEDHGEDSKEAESARQEESAWAERIQPMQTEWHRIGMTQQGSVDLDTGSVTTIKRAFREVSGKPLTEKQSEQAKEYHDTIKAKDKKIADLQEQLDELQKGEPTVAEKGIKEKSKDLAKKIRENAKLNRPGMFSAATPASVVWDGAVEVVAKSIEAGGAIADAINKGLKFVRESDWYKGLSIGEQKDAISQFRDWHKENGMTNAERLADLKKQVTNNIARIRRQISEKERSAKLEKKPIHTDEEYRRMKEDEKTLQSLLDKYLPEKPFKYADEKALKQREKTLNTQISELNDQINKGERKVSAKGPEDTEIIKQLKEIKKAKEEELEEIAPKNPNKVVKTSKKIDIQSHFVNKKDNVFTNEESKAIWERVKEIIKDGETDFHNVINQVGMDTGLTNEQVRRAISQPKGAKVVTDKMYAEMYRRNQVLQSAKIWVKSADLSANRKFWSKVIKVPSAIVTALHGSVAPITHVGGDLYRPSNWGSYFKFMLDSYKFSFGGITEAGKARYEKAMSDLVRDPMYMMAKKAGLRIDPTDFHSDDYSNYQSVFGRLAKMGERGFNAMKPYRLEQFKKIYNGLSDQAKANPEVVKAAAHIVNLQSGTTEVKIPPGTDLVMFAPKLVVSQYQRIFTEPAKAVNSFVHWKTATDAQKLQARMVAKHSAQMIATYLAGLAANQAILSLTGSKQSINFTNPLGSDWMKFKVFGKDVDASGGMNSALRFVASLVEEGMRANGIIKTDEKGKPGDTEGRKILQQATNKLSPLAGDIVELFSGTDNMGNPLPWSSVKPSKGKEQLTWGKYFESKSPIFIAEGFKVFNESAQESGMPQATLNNYLEGVIIGILAGTTGAHIGPDNSLKQKEKSEDRGDTGGGGAGGNFDR